MMNIELKVNKKTVKSILAKRECFGCPPNGDGMTVKGEPDRRCRDTKGETSPKVSAPTKSTSPLSKNEQKLARFEEQINDLTYEQGMFVSNGKEVKGLIAGTETSAVAVYADKVRNLPEEKRKSMSFTHNHPSGGGFSDGDFVSGFYTGIGEVRAVCKEGDGGIYLYSMKINKQLSEKEANDIGKKHREQIMKLAKQYGAKKTGTKYKSDALVRAIHESTLITQRANPGLFEYERKKIN